MDDEIARMLADLGTSRRDVLSAPEEEQRGRLVREDVHQQQRVLASDEARRKRICDTGDQTEEAERLRAWNMPSNFESSGAEAGLENRYNGQGHRAGLKVRRQYDGRAEATEARYGEERRRYLQERDANQNTNYVATGGPAPGQPASRATPRIVPNGKSAQHVSRVTPRVTPAGSSTYRSRQDAVNPQTRQRAPSPRSFGTTRFLPSANRTTSTPASAKPIIPAPAAETMVMINRNQALWYAANPSEADAHYRQYPQYLPFLDWAREKLAKEVVELLSDEAAAAQYVLDHKERAWMLEAAKVARYDAKCKTAAENAIKYDAEPDLKYIYEVAKAAVMIEDGLASSTPLKPNDKNSYNDGGQAKSSTSNTATAGASSSLESQGKGVPRGSLMASFFDVAGSALGQRDLPIEAPVEANMSIKSQSEGFNPLQLVDAIEALGNLMLARTQKLAGVHLTSDGLWETNGDVDDFSQWSKEFGLRI